MVISSNQPRSQSTLITHPEDTVLSALPPQSTLQKPSLSPTNLASKYTHTNQKIEEISEKASTTSTSRTSQAIGMRPNSEPSLANTVTSSHSLWWRPRSQARRRKPHSLSSASKTPVTRSTAPAAHSMPFNKRTTRSTKAWNSTSKRLSPSNKEHSRKRESKTDSRTQRRDATCTWRTSQRTPLRSNSDPTSRSTVKSKASSSTTKKVLQFMPSFATRAPRVPLMPSNNQPLKP